jgi:hypothetical protein
MMSDMNSRDLEIADGRSLFTWLWLSAYDLTQGDLHEALEPAVVRLFDDSDVAEVEFRGLFSKSLLTVLLEATRRAS